MYQSKSRAQTLVLIILDYIGIFCSVLIANCLRHGQFFGGIGDEQIYLTVAICLAIHTAQVFFRDHYSDFNSRGYFKELVMVIKYNLVITLCVIVVLFLLKRLDGISRMVYVLFFVVDLVLMYFTHCVWKSLIPKLYRSVVDRRRIVIVATKEMVDNVIVDIYRTNEYIYDISGIILIDGDEESVGTSIGGVPVVARLDDAIDYCQTAPLDEAIVAVGTHNRAIVMDVMNALSNMGVTVHYNIRTFELEGANAHEISMFGSFYTITYMNRSVSLAKLTIKRIMDIVGGLIGSIFFVIFYIIFGPIIKLTSKGPVLFKQDRVGRNGRVFKIYKFRSMCVDAEERKAELMNDNEMDDSGLMFKMENDPRITKIGRFLRKTSIDEFPQFINVLKGDMSLVGTRPPTLDEFEKYEPAHKKRLSFKPGITGMWQAYGRNDISDFDEVVRLDVEYINNWSVGLDIKILGKTIFVALKGK